MLFYLPIIVLLFGVFQQFFRRKDIWLDLFARLSFFIFFIHGYFAALIRSVFAKLVDGNGSLYPVLEVPLIVAAFVSMLALSILTYLVLKLCLRERSRLIIGG